MSGPLTERDAVDSLGQTIAAPSVELGDTFPTASAEVPARGAPMDLQPFGPFSRIEPLSEQGAMGVVARGYHAAFDRWELLKFLRPELSTDPEIVRQFFREGRVLAKLSHPNVVRVFALYALGGRPCLAMEFLEGRSLRAYGEEHGGKAPLAELYDLFLAAARGLSAAHEIALLHRDLKPENLFVARDRPGAPGGLKLIDFGLATAYRTRGTGDFDPALVARTSGGTPLFMAPELWRGEMASPKTDIYALGVSFFLLVTGRLPFSPEGTLHEMSRVICSDAPYPDARELRPETPAPLALALKRATSKIKSERFDTAEDLVVALTAGASASRPRRVPGSGPYRGLERYGASERDIFFGRDTEIAEVLERLRDQPGVVLAGPSGSGKSSLARAGVLPAVEDGALGGGVAYRSVLLEPRTSPLRSLAAALAKTLGPTESEVLAFLRERPSTLGQALRTALPQDAGIVLLVDQLEEIATVAADAAEARDFAIAIGSLLDVAAAPLRLIATLRADRMDRLFALEPLRPLLTRGFYPVRLLGGEALRRAVVEPAAAAGFRLEDPLLADAIVRDVSGSPGALPLLSFAMAAWWSRRDEAARTLPTRAWRDLGGLAGALAQHGDRVLEAMSDDERRAAEPLLVRLVSADRTRVPVPRATLIDPASTGPGAARALGRLLDANLVQESSGSIQLAHDALVTGWPRLSALLVSSGVDRAFHERVTATARPWNEGGRPDGALWTGEQAQRLLRWFSSTDAPLDQTELAFIEAVRTRRTRAQRTVRVATGLAIVIPLAFGLVALSNAREMKKRALSMEESLAKAKASYSSAEAGRLQAVAARDVARDPSSAVRSAAAGFELAHDPALDVLAWEARARGLGMPLVSLEKRIPIVQIAPRTRWLAAAMDQEVVTLDGASAAHAVHDAGSAVSALRFSPDGGRLAIGTEDGSILIADGPAAAPRRVARCAGAVRHLAWPAPATLTATCRAPGSAWQVLAAIDAATGSAPPGRAFGDDVSAIDASAADGSVLLGRPSGEVSLVSAGARTGDKPVLARLTQHKGRVVVVSRGPGDATLSIDAGLHATLRAGEVSRALELGSTAFAWMEGRQALAVVGADGSVQLVSLATGEVLGDMPSPRHPITSLGADSAGEWLVAGTRDGLLLAFDVDQGAVAVTQAPSSPAPSCALSADGTAVGCVASGSATIRHVQRSSGIARPTTIAHFSQTAAHPLLLGPGGTPVYAVAGALLEHEGEADRPLGLTPSVFATSDKRFALAGAGESGAASLAMAPYDLASPPAILPWAAAVTASIWSADSSRLFVASADGHVRALDAASHAVTEIAGLDGLGPRDSIRALSVDDGGRVLALGTAEGDLWRAPIGGHDVRRVAKLGAAIACVRFAREGRAVLAAAGRDTFVVDMDGGGSFHLWESSAPIVDCARSGFSDRFTFVDADGGTWLRALDLAGVSVSYVPPDPADHASKPSLEEWRGLPADL